MSDWKSGLINDVKAKRIRIELLRKRESQAVSQLREVVRADIDYLNRELYENKGVLRMIFGTGEFVFGFVLGIDNTTRSFLRTVVKFLAGEEMLTYEISRINISENFF